MDNLNYAIPLYTTAEEIKRVRKNLNLTQKEFAKLLGVSDPTIVRWETSKEHIKGPIVLLLYFFDNNPKAIEELRIPAKTWPLRLIYMYKQKICTVIDVNVIQQEVNIKNYTNNIMYKAFGVNDNPSFSDYNEFLKSRCFPETRDKLKLVLADLGIPFYDPLLIIEKTEGRMAEDDFWVKVEV